MRRRLGFFLIVGAAVSLIAVSTAWACGVLATLKLDQQSAKPGDVVKASGRNYLAANSGTPPAPTNASAVEIRLNNRTGPLLATIPPPDGGAFSNQNITIPSGLSPGWYVVLATQFNSNGTPKSGTPGRTSIKISGVGAASRRRHSGGAVVTPWSSSKPTGGGGAALAVNAGNPSGAGFVPSLLGIMLALGLFGTGLVLVMRSRTAHRPRLDA
ncbi:MAG: hypothetical protein M3065_00990 [Actinomycetota bacterium]|nr:hypothetical protein [Actinomycetota bacterium]